MIASGMWVQSAGIVLFVAGTGFPVWLVGSVLLGLGTAMVYPTLSRRSPTSAHPDWRASAVGVYRLWRDGGYAIGALLSGLLADAFDLRVSVAAVAGLTFLSGLVVAVVMRETIGERLKVGGIMLATGESRRATETVAVWVERASRAEARLEDLGAPHETDYKDAKPSLVHLMARREWPPHPLQSQRRAGSAAAPCRALNSAADSNGSALALLVPLFLSLNVIFRAHPFVLRVHLIVADAFATLL